jgi:hypothetical protein
MRTKKMKNDPVVSSNDKKIVEIVSPLDSAPLDLTSSLENHIEASIAHSSFENEIIATTIVVEKKKRGRKKLIKPDPTNLTSSNNDYNKIDDLKDDTNINVIIDEKMTSNEYKNGTMEKKPRKVRVSKKVYNQQQHHEGPCTQYHTTDEMDCDKSIQEEENVSHLSTSNVVVHKKRGRKPRGGKIIHENQIQKNNNPEVPNIILHLKCVLSDLKKLNDVNSHKLDEYCSEKKMEILCYNDNNDQNNAFSSNVSNVTKFDNENEVINTQNIMKTQSKHAVTTTAMSSKEEEKKNLILLSTNTIMNQKYDPLTFSSKNIHPTPIPIINETNVSTNAHPFSFSEKEVTNSDYSLECKNATNKEIWKKISQLKLNFHKNDALGVQRSACFWDTCEFDTPPIYIPMSTSKGYGCFCHPECAVAFLMKENIDTSVKFERYYLLNSIYGPIYNYNKSIKPAANPHYLLNKFYGNLTITEYRKLFQCEQVVYMVNKPLTNVLPELYEDNNDFFIGNKIIQNSTIEVKKKGSKSVKSSIINEAFGIR